MGGVCESGREQRRGGEGRVLGGSSLSSGKKAVEKLRVGLERSHHQRGEPGTKGGDGEGGARREAGEGDPRADGEVERRGERSLRGQCRV